jgi:hypothetical protein
MVGVEAWCSVDGVRWTVFGGRCSVAVGVAPIMEEMGKKVNWWGDEIWVMSNAQVA